ncbi:MAG: transposase [Candidatus Parcubacteria bacterium]|nr:transposase [Candidatus Parcubacteria bacterium]
MEYFRNKYRVPTTRLQHWDYSLSGFYYLTVCTKKRECCLSEIRDGQVYLSKVGEITFECWFDIPKHFEFIELDDWIIMPNHLHGILIFKENDFGSCNCRDARSRVSTVNKFGPLKPKSLSSVIHAFKSAVKRECNKNNLSFAWQARYYEHIITGDNDYSRIKEYIAYNPINWQKDENNPININK